MSGPIQKAELGYEHTGYRPDPGNVSRTPLPPRARTSGALVPTEFMLRLATGDHRRGFRRAWNRVYRTPPGAFVISKGDFHTESGFKELAPDLVEHLKGLPA